MSDVTKNKGPVEMPSEDATASDWLVATWPRWTWGRWDTSRPMVASRPPRPWGDDGLGVAWDRE